MRETRNAQISIFEFYSKHEQGQQLKRLSELLDQSPHVLTLIAQDFQQKPIHLGGCVGLSLESIFRCLVLKQLLQVSYKQLAFHLSDSASYRSFARLSHESSPSKSSLQSLIRQITPDTLMNIAHFFMRHWHDQKLFSLDQLRIDSTVIASNIAPPSDSQLLNDGIRVISRLLAKSKDVTGHKLRFTDQRKTAKSLAFRVFNSKRADKERLYPELLRVANIVLKQADRALRQAASKNPAVQKTQWFIQLTHFQDLLERVRDQARRRVILKESVPSSEKIVSLFEPHSDVIVKSFRDIQYGHKVNLATVAGGFVTGFSLEKGNPNDKDLFLPMLNEHQARYGVLPKRTIADGGYASQANVRLGRAQGVETVAFHKPVNLGLHEMGLKKKTLIKLRHFRAGIEGNISELKRAFGATKAQWKGEEGFTAFAWSSVLTYNLMHWVRLKPT